MPEMTKNTMAKLLKELRKAEQENQFMKIELARLKEEKKMMKAEIRKLRDKSKLLVFVAVCCGCLLIAVLVGNEKRGHAKKDLGLQMLV